MEWIAGGLILLIIYQHWFYSAQIQKLVDKLMSRSYTEYVKADAPPVIRDAFFEDSPDDLGSLKEFSA